MSSDETSDVSAVSAREAVREKAQQVQAKQARVRVLRRSIVGVVAVALVGAVGFGVCNAIGSVADEPVRQPTGMSADGVLIAAVSGQSEPSDATLAETTPTPTPTPEASPTATPTAAEAEEFTLADGAVDIHIYVDYLSPHAGKFQRANARQLSGWITEGAVTVTYHPVALLTTNSNGTKYSQRAAAAAACVATHSPEQFTDFNHELLVDQPEVDSDGLSNDDLAVLAQAVGVDSPKVVRACIEEQHYATWAKEATTRALDGPLPGSRDLALVTAPMVVVNGQAYVGALDNPAEFSQFVLTVASDAYYASATPTPTPTP